ncbi:unnamed protein product [Lactuca saligna]|uniref:Uncharacterized protein n=1 Tax=Lactuca saligna TaxID=75948 RepID=A0AA36EFE6_LACSI|nr:unnamed protein product [Lactuca saligna]
MIPNVSETDKMRVNNTSSRLAPGGGVVLGSLLVSKSYFVYLSPIEDGPEPFSSSRDAGLQVNNTDELMSTSLLVESVTFTSNVFDAMFVRNEVTWASVNQKSRRQYRRLNNY